MQPVSRVGRPAAIVPPVMITTTGSTFSPWVMAPAYVTVTWTWAEGSTTGLQPTINFGSAATRTVYMTATDASGNDALNQITLFNIGFSSLDDPGRNSLPALYNWTAQPVSGLANVNSMTGLQLFLAADNATLTGPLNFNGMSRLTHIECYQSSFTSATVAGCTAMIRLVLEQNKLTTIDPTPCAATLQELRVAFQQTGVMTFPAVMPAFPNLYHWCTRDQTVTNMPDFSATGPGFPALNQLWIWNTGQSGALIVNSSVVMDSVLAHNNAYTSVNLANQFPYSGGQFTAQIAMASCALTSINITGDGLLFSVDFSANALPQAQVDSVLTTMNGFGSTDSLGLVDVSGGTNATPSATGLAAAAALRLRSWTVNTN